MQEIFRMPDIKHRFTSAYHAQGDGAVEKTFRTFANVLRQHSFINQNNWYQIVHIAAFTINTAKKGYLATLPLSLCMSALRYYISI